MSTRSRIERGLASAIIPAPGLERPLPLLLPTYATQARTIAIENLALDIQHAYRTIADDPKYAHFIRILDKDTVDQFCKTHTGVLDSCIHTSDCGIRPVIVGLHEIVQNVLSEITLAQLVGTEAKVDATLHQIQKSQVRLGSMRSAN